MGGRGSRPMSEKQLNEHRQVCALETAAALELLRNLFGLRFHDAEVKTVIVCVFAFSDLWVRTGHSAPQRGRGDGGYVYADESAMLRKVHKSFGGRGPFHGRFVS